jgi:uncharacterized protein YecE (DUF72 family)
MKKKSEIRSLSAPWLPLRIGAPVWACSEWAGQVYPERTPRTAWLQWYSATFNTVEGNSTFYALPPIETFEKWAEQTLPGFQFSFKFPKQISHDAQLQHCQTLTRDFLSRIEVLAKADRLGPTFLQLGPAFGPDRLAHLESYLQSLPREFPWAVEVRHEAWFDADTAQPNAGNNSNEQRLNELLRRLAIDKVLFDSRPLFQSPPEDPIETESQARKPKTPVRQTVTAGRPMLRIVGRNRVELADRFFDQWAPIVAGWIRNGLNPTVFTHAPNDARAPELARRFLAALQKHLPDFELKLPQPAQRPQQLSFLEE